MGEVIKWLGYRWLLARYGVRTVQPLAVETRLGRVRKIIRGSTELRIVPPALDPGDRPTAHLGYALKHEGVHFEALARIFQHLPAVELEAWIAAEPTGQYARRAGFFYEFLTGHSLRIAPLTMGNYVDALDPARELVSPAAIRVPRWRVRDNLLGTAAFTPQVRLSPAVQATLGIDPGQEIAALEGRYGRDLVQRSAVWLTVKESRSSFAIEHADRHLDRVQRFAQVIGRDTGRAVDPLAEDALLAIQAAILGPNALHYGLRRSPVFVGEQRGWNEEVVHYIAPHWDDVPALMAGLAAVMARTGGLSSVARAAIASFAFVYIHPMVDGNGRIGRFLINDILRRDGAVPEPLIVPVSATLQDPRLQPLSYDAALEIFSRPFMERYADQWRLGVRKTGEDGVAYNLEFDAYEDALPAWRYPDLSRHVECLGAALLRSIRHDMHDEALYLQQHEAARMRLKAVLEGPNSDLDRIIRSVREQNGRISGKLREEFPRLADAGLAEAVSRAVLGA